MSVWIIREKSFLIFSETILFYFGMFITCVCSDLRSSGPPLWWRVLWWPWRCQWWSWSPGAWWWTGQSRGCWFSLVKGRQSFNFINLVTKKGINMVFMCNFKLVLMVFCLPRSIFFTFFQHLSSSQSLVESYPCADHSHMIITGFINHLGENIRVCVWVVKNNL